MKKQITYTLAALTLLTLSGCGLKGPLYFPPQEPEQNKKQQVEQPKTDSSTQKSEYSEKDKS